MTSKLPLAIRATLFLTLVFVSFVAIDIWRTLHERAIQLKETQTQTDNFARFLDQQASDTVTAADSLLISVLDLVNIDGVGPAALKRLQLLMAKEIAQNHSLNGVIVFDENGRWLVNSDPRPIPTTYNNSDREYFIFHRDHTDEGPHISPPIKSRTSGAWIVPVTRRINYPDGRFAGVILASISMNYFKNFYGSFDIGKEGAIVFALDNGIVFLRRPGNEAFIGANQSNMPLFKFLAREKVGSKIFVSPTDKIERVYSYRHLERYPLIVAAALSKNEVLADWRANTILHSIVTALLALILGALGFRLVRQITLHAKTEATLLNTQRDLQNTNETLEKLAMEDGLTGLANRRKFDSVLPEEFARAMRGCTPLAMIMIDIDYFKQYNDLYGHPAGDEALRLIGRALKNGPVRPGDLIARYGGEEFVVLLPGTDSVGAQAVAEKCSIAVRMLEIAHSGNPYGIITISAGIKSMVPVRFDDSPIKLVEDADKALYVAKSRGRNRICSEPG